MITARDRWAENGGVRIESVEWAPSNDSGALPVVFVPGGTGVALSGEDLGREIAGGLVGGQPRRFLAVSRRGMGASDAPPSGYTPADFASDVEAAVREADYPTFILFGHSMGVPISLEYVLRNRERVAALVLGDTPAAYIDFKAAKTFDGVLARSFEYPSWDAAFEGLGWTDRQAFDRVRHRTLEESGASIRLRIDRAALVRTVEESVSAATEYWVRLKEIGCPVLVLVGTGGQWSPLSGNDVQRYRQSLPDVVIDYVTGGHDLGMRTNRKPLYTALTRFLRGAAVT